MNSETHEMENAVKSVAGYLECDYVAAAVVCQAAILNDLAADISRIADALEIFSTCVRAVDAPKEAA
jgi:hypothetical protein